MARLCRAGREAAGLEGVSPALRAGASDFGKTRSFPKSHQRSSPPFIRPTYVGFLRLTRLSDGSRWRAFGLCHPWRRPKSASNIPVLAPNRVELGSPFPDLAHGPTPLARHPVSRPRQAGSSQRGKREQYHFFRKRINLCGYVRIYFLLPFKSNSNSGIISSSIICTCVISPPLISKSLCTSLFLILLAICIMCT